MIKEILKEYRGLVAGLTLAVLLAAGLVIASTYYAETVNVYEDNQAEQAEEPQFGAGSYLPTKWVKQGNLVSYVESGEFIDASTTIVSFHNPFGSPTSTDASYNEDYWYQVAYDATTTIELGRLNITGVATTTYKVKCGPASDAYSDPTYSFIETDAEDSGTAVTTSSEAVLGNSATSTLAFGDTLEGSGLLLTPEYSWFVCKVTTVNDAYDGAFTETTNTFDGNYSFRLYSNY